MLQRTVELAQSLIRIPSFNPPGNEDQAAIFIIELLERAGIPCQRLPLEPERSSVYARIPGTGEEEGAVVLCGHLDTVTTDAEKWTHPPFEARVEGNRLWGLGSADMKSGVAAIIQAVIECDFLSRPPRRDIVLLLTADEECGYRGAAAAAESGLIHDAKIILIAEPSSGDVYTGQKGELWVETTFHGEEAHGSVPHSGTSALLPAAAFCTALTREFETFSHVPGAGRTTLCIGQFHSGRQVNIVPDAATVQLDMRLIEPEDFDRIQELLKRTGASVLEGSDARCETRVLSYNPPILLPDRHGLLERLSDAVKSIRGDAPRLCVSPYSTDAVSIAPVLDIPVLIYGPGSIAQAHRPDEFVSLEDIDEAVRTFALFLRSI